jgi:hypothetical protein
MRLETREPLVESNEQATPINPFILPRRAHVRAHD